MILRLAFIVIVRSNVSLNKLVMSFLILYAAEQVILWKQYRPSSL